MLPREKSRLPPLLLLAHVVAAAAKHPVVKWGQKSDRLYLKIMVKGLQEPDIRLQEKRLRISGMNDGSAFDLDMKLLRAINVTGSKKDIHDWSINLDLQKARKEPCWKRLLRSSAKLQWLKKDHDRIYEEDCARARERWREAYFTAKLDGKDVNVPRPSKNGEEPAQKKPPADPREDEQKSWRQTVQSFRDRAVPRVKKQARRRRKGGRATEL